MMRSNKKVIITAGKYGQRIWIKISTKKQRLRKISLQITVKGMILQLKNKFKKVVWHLF